jgi:hypothetical protein
MNLFQKWLLILVVTGIAALVETRDRRDFSCSASKLDCPRAKSLPGGT